MHVSLTPTLEELVRKKVESGRYNNASEVVREALRLMQSQDEIYEAKLEQLRQALAEGERSGIAKDFSFKRLMEELDREAKEEGLLE